jgi:hypothetical protein
MEKIHALEVRIAEWYKPLPHLPQGGIKWLTENIWWLILIGVIISAFGAVSLVLITIFGGVFLAGAVFLYSAQFGGLALLIAAIAAGVSILNIVVAAMAIDPLKNKQKKGWSLLFIALLLSFIPMLFGDILRFHIFSMIEDVLMIAVGGYFLFEIRDQYAVTGKSKVPKKAPAFVAPAHK